MKIKQLQNQLQGEAKKQEDLLANKLAARRLRNKNIVGEMNKNLEEKEERIEQLDEERYNLQEKFDEMVENGANDDKMKDKLQRDKEQALI